MFRRRGSPPRYSPYQAFVVEEMILRDHLAMDRTSLANERTLLSYSRTALACVLGGASAMHFLTGVVTDIVGVALIASGVVIVVFGAFRFLWYKQRIEAVLAASALPPRPLPGATVAAASAAPPPSEAVTGLPSTPPSTPEATPTTTPTANSS